MIGEAFMVIFTAIVMALVLWGMVDSIKGDDDDKGY